MVEMLEPYILCSDSASFGGIRLPDVFDLQISDPHLLPFAIGGKGYRYERYRGAMVGVAYVRAA